jgi:hypothetical protein
MAQIAEDTGGSPYFDTNDLATAVQQAIESGSNYYTLGHEPMEHTDGGEYRQIHITLNADLKTAGYSLSYRHGYFIDSEGDGDSRADSPARPAEDARAKYVALAMTHGAPCPQDILFKVRILPMAEGTEQEIAPNNIHCQKCALKPPFRRYAIDLVAVPDAFELSLGHDQVRSGRIEFSVLLYDSSGDLMNAVEKSVQLSLTPSQYRWFLSGVHAHFEISVPAKTSETFLRVGVHDVPSNRMGVVEVPVSSLSRLQPLRAKSSSLGNRE